MSEAPQTPDLGPLHERYEIIGELRGSGDIRTYVGRRRKGGGEVVIMVAPTPRGDQNNALSHYAADTQLLTASNDPRLPRVLEGVWLGSDAYARVTEPIRGTSLGQRLSAGEHFANARIATVLQAVHGVLDWAREHGVVHRGVTLDTLYFERDGERVRVLLAPMAIPMSGVPDACADAKTIGTLAWAMLSGKQFDPKQIGSFAQLAPNLARRVIDATETIMQCSGDEVPNVLAFLATVGMADALKEAEVELAALKEQYDEEHRLELEKCEQQRAAVEHHAMEQTAMLAGEREQFKHFTEDERAAIAAERVEFESAAAGRQRQLGDVREQLDAQRADVERRLADLNAHRAELEKYRTEIDGFRSEAERVRGEVDRARKEADRAKREAVEARAAVAAAIAAAQKAATPGEGDRPVAGDKLARVNKAVDRLMRKKPTPVDARALETALPALPPVPELPAAPAVPAVPAMPVSPRAMRRDRKPEKKIEKMFNKDLSSPVTADGDGANRPTWMIPVIAVVVFVVLGVIAFGIDRFHRNAANAIAAGQSKIVPTAPTVPSGGMPTGGFLTQSAGGSVSPHYSGSPLVNPDSAHAASPAAPSAAATDSAAAAAVDQSPPGAPPAPDAHPDRPKPKTDPRTPDAASPYARPFAPVVVDTTRRTPDSVPSAQPIVPPNVQPIRRDSAPPRDTTIRRDTVRPDTVIRRDTIVRRDTIRPDTAVFHDTTGTRR